MPQGPVDWRTQDKLREALESRPEYELALVELTEKKGDKTGREGR
jgi:hypothetical protein